MPKQLKCAYSCLPGDSCQCVVPYIEGQSRSEFTPRKCALTGANGLTRNVYFTHTHTDISTPENPKCPKRRTHSIMRSSNQLPLLLLVLTMVLLVPATTGVRVIFWRPLSPPTSTTGLNNANILRSPNLAGSSCGNGQVTDSRGICRSTISF